MCACAGSAGMHSSHVSRSLKEKQWSQKLMTCQCQCISVHEAGSATVRWIRGGRALHPLSRGHMARVVQSDISNTHSTSKYVRHIRPSQPNGAVELL